MPRAEPTSPQEIQVRIPLPAPAGIAELAKANGPAHHNLGRYQCGGTRCPDGGYFSGTGSRWFKSNPRTRCAVAQSGRASVKRAAVDSTSGAPTGSSSGIIGGWLYSNDLMGATHRYVGNGRTATQRPDTAKCGLTDTFTTHTASPSLRRMGANPTESFDILATILRVITRDIFSMEPGARIPTTAFVGCASRAPSCRGPW